MEKITGIGNALVDVLVRLPDDGLLHQLDLPKGGMILIDEQRQVAVQQAMAPLHPRLATGGSAGNAMLALANLHAQPGFIGKIGEDEMGRFLMDNCRERGIDPHFFLCQNHTGVANTLISLDGERTFATCLGAASMMSGNEVSDDLFLGYQILHIEGYLVQNHVLMEVVAHKAKAQGMRLSIDLASYNVVREDLAFFRHLVQDYIDIVFANEEESAAFTGLSDPRDALDEIARHCEIAVVKLGSKGSCVKRGDEVAVVRANRVDVVDTTAAGDFFAGGFLYALTRGASLKKCLLVGALLSENVIQIVGTRLSDERWASINNKVEEILKN
ncbi:MAG: adenosine kinase [Bacteroidaceae bacterium]|nr:adenosine kinase [Bacteroidaceae bacterium]